MQILSLLATPFAIILAFIYNLIGNYGISLIVFTLVICAAMIPLYAKQIKSTSRMSEIQPKIQAIQTKYANDQQTMNIKLQELYKQEHYSPTQGCLPMIIQMLVIMGLFAMLRNPMSFIDVTKNPMYEALVMGTHESFLWIKDLSQPDPWILPILTGVAQFLTTFLGQQTNPAPQQAGMGAMKMMNYFFPVMILWLGRSMPAGLTMYWCVRSVFTIVQTIFLNKAREKELLRHEVEKEFK